MMDFITTMVFVELLINFHADIHGVNGLRKRMLSLYTSQEENKRKVALNGLNLYGALSVRSCSYNS